MLIEYGKDVKVYCKFWKIFIETVSRSQEVKLRGKLWHIS
jgi:hypothetical protein